MKRARRKHSKSIGEELFGSDESSSESREEEWEASRPRSSRRIFRPTSASESGRCQSDGHRRDIDEFLEILKTAPRQDATRTFHQAVTHGDPTSTNIYIGNLVRFFVLHLHKCLATFALVWEILVVCEIRIVSPIAVHLFLWN